MKNPYLGKWCIREMEVWDKDFIDLVVPGYCTFDDEGLGKFQFGAVEGYIDYRIESWGDMDRLEFSWEGSDEGDRVSGRGWAVIEGNELRGRLYIHLGDDSGFVCVKDIGEK
jgi:hypothetical protein